MASNDNFNQETDNERKLKTNEGGKIQQESDDIVGQVNLACNDNTNGNYEPVTKENINRKESAAQDNLAFEDDGHLNESDDLTIF